MGHEVEVISPDQFKTFPLPTYPEIKVAIGAYEPVQERFKAFEPEAIHIATEGPIGLAARRICVEWKLPFTTSYHTRFPEYVSARLPLPLAAGYAYMKWFHKPSGRLMVATPTMRDELARHGFRNISRLVARRRHRACSARARRTSPTSSRAWRGRSSSTSAGWRWRRTSRPSWRLDLPGTKVVVGDGPQLRGAEGEVPQGGLHRRQVRRRAGRPLRLRRRLRLPLAHRHLRPGDPGGHGGRHAGGGLSGARARSTSSRARARACWRQRHRGPARGLPGVPGARPRPGARLRREVLLARLRRGLRAATCSPIPSRRRPASGGGCAGWPGCAARPKAA